MHEAFRIKNVNWQRFTLILNILRRLEGSTDGILRLLFPTYTTLEAPQTVKISNSVQYIFKKSGSQSFSSQICCLATSQINFDAFCQI